MLIYVIAMVELLDVCKVSKKMYLSLTQIFYIDVAGKNITTEWDILLWDCEKRLWGLSWRVTVS